LLTSLYTMISIVYSTNANDPVKLAAPTTKSILVVTFGTNARNVVLMVAISTDRINAMRRGLRDTYLVEN